MTYFLGVLRSSLCECSFTHLLVGGQVMMPPCSEQPCLPRCALMSHQQPYAEVQEKAQQEGCNSMPDGQHSANTAAAPQA